MRLDCREEEECWRGTNFNVLIDQLTIGDIWTKLADLKCKLHTLHTRTYTHTWPFNLLGCPCCCPPVQNIQCRDGRICIDLFVPLCTLSVTNILLLLLLLRFMAPKHKDKTKRLVIKQTKHCDRWRGLFTIYKRTTFFSYVVKLSNPEIASSCVESILLVIDSILDKIANSMVLEYTLDKANQKLGPHKWHELKSWCGRTRCCCAFKLDWNIPLSLSIYSLFKCVHVIWNGRTFQAKNFGKL